MGFVEKTRPDMRIVASDYDGTVYDRGGLLGDDVPGAVRRWRAAGNLFGFATGRDFSMIAPEADKWGFEADFFVCINGAAIYSGDRALLHHVPLEDDLVAALARHPAADASLHLQLSGIEPLRLVVREGSWFPKLGFVYSEVTREEAATLRGLGQISVAYRDLAECQRWEAVLRRDFGDRISPHRNKFCIDICPPGVDKATGLAWLAEHQGWDPDAITPVGDGINDLAMIRRYHGYTVPGAQPEAAAAAAGEYASVAAMLEQLTSKPG